ncbi:MAG: redoxin domain-containing protein [Phycisphaerae bacterium]|nr:redoxin domain-containing protein [Phycisphaerae bacterium]
MKNSSKSLAFIFAAGLASSFAFAAIAADDKHKDHAKDGHKHVDGEKHGDKSDKTGKSDKKMAAAQVGKAAPAFTLKTTDGKDWSLSDAAGKIVVLQWVNPECPVCQRVMKDGTVTEGMKGATEASKDVVFVMINSSAARPSSLEGTAAYLKEHKMTAPALLDNDGAVGQLYGAKTTPHIFVIDGKGVLRYQGAIDDSADGSGKGKTNYVTTAVQQIAGNETVAPTETKPYGCGVKYAKKS